MLPPSSVSSWLPFTGKGGFGAMFFSMFQFYGGGLFTWTQEPEGYKMAKWFHSFGNCKITKHYFGGDWGSG